MTCKHFISLAALIALAMQVCGAEPSDAAKVPHKVKNVELLDLSGNSVTLPYWGEKNLMIFYVDPDRHSQNEDFTDDMEANHRVEGDNIVGYGVLNLKDSGLPNAIVKKLAAKRTAKNGATVLADQNRVLSTEWQLGDCNNKFVLILVSKEGELVFLRKGELTAEDKAEFYKTVEKYK